MASSEDEPYYRTLSFSGCGFLCIYHAGVCAAIKEYAPQLLCGPVSGASAGSIISACLVCNVCISRATSIILNVVNQARSHTFGALNRDFDLMGIVRADLEMELPENAHVLCSGRLRISLTRMSDMKNVVVSQFDSKADLIQAIICSCFIPVYGGLQYPQFHGETYIDGGVTDNQPVVDKHTITVSPFSGANDICPSDADSASMFDLMFAGTSIRFTANNLYRVLVSLFPPSADACSRMCRQGFTDALRFLTNNGLAPCARCLTVQANSIIDSSMQTPALRRTRRIKSYSSLSAIGNKVRKVSECETCNGKAEPFLEAGTSPLFPKIMQKPFEEVVESETTLLAYLQSFRLIDAAKFLGYPLKVNVQLLRFCASLISWLAGRASDWFTQRLQRIITFILREIGSRQILLHSDLTRQVQVANFESGSKDQLANYREETADWNLSAQQDKWLSSAVEKHIPDKTKGLAEEVKDTCWQEEVGDDVDSISRVVDYVKHHDAVLAFYYMDDRKQMHMCEIFDMDHENKRHECHSHLDRLHVTQPRCSHSAETTTPRFS
ncbi:Uncharacterized protein C05D11.7 [Toxocara canis]|uniref:Uncharacterized protein C05D11.7 n=2 Tax=Toxocara canis TaxID=6265 RepID=A0A0B2UXG3_TOXCA|nr:Uncharacterized protein C05D11.7 [Toxocara canis]VDM39725.1 unnamed protein product [Toxocara canis]